MDFRFDLTLIAVTAITPYIALQLQSVTRSYEVISGSDASITTAFYIALGLGAFAILFGTRNLDANERHHGVVAVSYTHLTLPTTWSRCRSRWSPDH